MIQRIQTGSPLPLFTQFPQLLSINLCLVLIFFLFLPLSGTAQKSKLDSLINAHDTVVTKYYKHISDSLHTGKLNTVHPTQLTNFQRYDPLIEDQHYFASLGNVGLAHLNLVYEPHFDPGFHFGIRSWDQYKFTIENLRYYLHTGPLSYLSYTNGAKKEQLFRAVYSQHIGKSVVVAADVKIVNSPGPYLQQKSDDRSVYVMGKYETKNKRYGVLASYFYNKFIWEENGGIANDSIFENNIETNRRTVDINLQTAQNLIKETGTIVNQYFFLTKAKPDSLVSKKRTFHLGRISYTFTYKNQQQIYTDQEPLSDFYSHFDTIIDTLQTHDSLIIKRFDNTFTWSNLSVNDDPLTKPIYISFSLRHQYADIGGYLDKRTFTSLIPMGELILRPLRTTVIQVSGNYTIGDFNNNGFYIGGYWHQDIRKEDKQLFFFKASAFLASQEKGFFYSNYQSNYLRWENDFKNVKTTHLGFDIGRKNITARAQYYLVSDYIYLNENAKPEQFESLFSILRISLTHYLRIKKFNFNYDLTYQQASNNDVLRIPAFMGRVGIMMTLPVFGNASVLQPGFDFYYNTAYYADSYLPSTRSFYQQNEKKIGNYVYADVFLNLLLKRFRIFAKYSHFNSFFGNYTYYTVPHYPMQDAAFRFGLSWTFYD